MSTLHARAFVVVLAVAPALVALPGASSADEGVSVVVDEHKLAAPLGTLDRQTFSTTARCDKSFTAADGSLHAYAEHAFAYAPESLLARVTVVGHGDGVSRNAPPGYASRVVTNGIFVRESALAVDCGVWMSPDAFTTVTLVLPRAYQVDTSDPWAETAPAPAPASH